MKKIEKGLLLFFVHGKEKERGEGAGSKAGTRTEPNLITVVDAHTHIHDTRSITLNKMKS
jgi:hypothetical protein